MGRMTTERRVGSLTSEKRALVLDATEAILVEDGYAAVTSRSIATRVGINPSLVHYYFPTLDDLFVGVLRRGAVKDAERLAAALASTQPLRSLWQLNLEPEGTALQVELLAVANHRVAIQGEIVEIVERHRRLQVAAFKELFDQYGIDFDAFPPELAAVAIVGTARLIVREQALGLTTGHDEALAAINRLIDELELRDARD
jgi:AcrR family transcriptional regulator